MNHYVIVDFVNQLEKSKYFIVSSKWVSDNGYVKYSIPESEDDKGFLSRMLQSHAPAPADWSTYKINKVTSEGNTCKPL